MNSLPVLKVTVEAPVTSFRYPHFLIGRQISFDMPPPSTIYGHVASALGELPDPAALTFGYDFRFVSRGVDLEHQHIITAGGAKFQHEGAKWPTNIQAVVQPHLRELLFRPKLTLYLQDRSLISAFLEPAFCVVLGRSQDLASYTKVEELDLIRTAGAYFEHTIVPFDYRPYIGRGVTVLMPRYIEPPPERRAHFERYITLQERVFAGSFDDLSSVAMNRRLIGAPGVYDWWADPSTPVDRGVHRAVLFHRFT